MIDDHYKEPDWDNAFLVTFAERCARRRRDQTKPRQANKRKQDYRMKERRPLFRNVQVRTHLFFVPFSTAAVIENGKGVE